MRARLGHALRNGLPDTFGRTGDQGHLVGQIKQIHHPPLLFVAVACRDGLDASSLYMK